MGYWNGEGWTGHKQPLPPAQEATPVSVVVPPKHAVDPVQPSTSAPHSIFAAVKEMASDPGTKANGTAAAGGALIADGVVGFGERRQGLGGAIGTILFGIAWLVFTLTPGMPLNNAEPRAGTIHTQGTVARISIDSKGQCSPVAEFVVDGKTYTVNSGLSEKPCPYIKGSKIDVTYHPSDVTATATIPPTGFFKTFLTFAPWIGILAIVAGAWTFILRAGSIAAGIVLLRKGFRARKALAEDREG